MYNFLTPFLSIGISLSLHVMNLIVVILGFVEVLRLLGISFGVCSKSESERLGFNRNRRFFKSKVSGLSSMFG